MVRLMEGEQECNNRTQTEGEGEGQIKGAPSVRPQGLTRLGVGAPSPPRR